MDHADIIEIDVQMNASGTLVLVHDRGLDRIARTPRRISDMSDIEISRVVLSDGSPLMTLEQALTWAYEK